MATLYTRVYTYAGQAKWTAAARSIDWSDFEISGDTDRAVGQIASIRCEHYHASTSHREWPLQARLVFSGGALTSDSVSHVIGSGDVAKYANVFSTLPSAAQLAGMQRLEILYGGSSAQTSSPYLTWRATPTQPIRVVVAFYEEAPRIYRPQIQKFSLARGTAAGAADDAGERALLTLQLSLASDSYAASSALKLYYAAGEVSTASSCIDLSSSISAFLGGVTASAAYISASFDADFDWNFLLVFSCADESASATAALPNHFVALHISPCSTGGVAVGDLSTATEGHPKFEVHHPAYFYGGIAQIGGSGVAEMLGIQTGVSDAIARVSNGTASAQIAFPKAYAAPPQVFVCFDTGDIASLTGPFGSFALSVAGVTAEGFTLRMSAATSTNFAPKVRWLAIGA